MRLQPVARHALLVLLAFQVTLACDTFGTAASTDAGTADAPMDVAANDGGEAGLPDQDAGDAGRRYRCSERVPKPYPTMEACVAAAASSAGCDGVDQSQVVTGAPCTRDRTTCSCAQGTVEVELRMRDCGCAAP